LVHFVHKIIALLGLFLVTVSITFGQNIEKEMKKQADKLFAEKQYVAATSTYLSLLSLYPSSSEYNYKYGACLLYNSAKKQTAIKFLASAVTDPAVDPIAYYFLGKAFHLNFQFNSAITNYQIFLTKSSDELRKKEVRRQLEMCENGKNLLRQLSDLVVLEKKETDPQNFFRSYNLEHIGGSIVVAADFQSKIDVKRKHFPLVYFPANSDTVYYSSFGDVDKGNKDIYFKTRTLEGTWSSAQTVKGMVNTNEDEDFPFLAADRHTLYFSSKGHNSMGGYDVFRSERVGGKHAFSTPINCDFAISTPDDDLFYITDSLGKYAYFASSRQSENGKLVVYKVRVTRVPSQLLVGDFTFEDEEQAAQLKASSELKPNAEKYSDAQFAFASKWSDIARDFGSPTATPVELKQNVNKLISDKETFVTAVTAVQQTVLVQLTDLIEEAQVHAENATKSYELAQTATSDSLRANALEETIFQLDFQQELMVTIRQLKSFDAELTTLRTGENTAIKQLKKSVDAVELAENNQTTELLVQALEQLAGILKPLDKSPPLSLEGHINDQKVALSLQKQVIETSLASNRITALSLNDTLQKLNASLTQAKSKNQSEISQSIALYKDELSAVESQIKRKEAQVKVFNDSLQYLSDRLNFTQLPGRNITIDSIGLQAALKAIQRAPLANFDQLSQASSQELSALKEKMGQATFVAESAANETNLKDVTEVIPNENNTKTSDEKVIEPVLNLLTTIEQDSSILDINPVLDVDTATTKATSETVYSVPDVQTTTSELSSETANPVAVYAKIEALLLPNYTEKSQQLLLQNDSVSLEKYRALTLEYLAIIDDALADSLESTNALTKVLYPEDRTTVLKSFRATLLEQLEESVQPVIAVIPKIDTVLIEPETIQTTNEENPTIVQLRPNYYKQIEQINAQENSSELAKQRLIFETDKDLQIAIQQAITTSKKAIKKDSTVNLQQQLAAYQLQESLLDARLHEQESILVLELKKGLNKEALIQAVSPNYKAVNFNDSTRWSTNEMNNLINQEKAFQAALTTTIQQHEKGKKYATSLEKIAENQLYNNLLDQSREVEELIVAVQKRNDALRYGSDSSTMEVVATELPGVEHPISTDSSFVQRDTLIATPLVSLKVEENSSEIATIEKIQSEKENTTGNLENRAENNQNSSASSKQEVTAQPTDLSKKTRYSLNELTSKFPATKLTSSFAQALNTQVSIEEEQEIALSSKYETLLNNWQSIALARKDAANITVEIEQTLARLLKDSTNATEHENYLLLIQKLSEIHQSIDAAETKLAQQIPAGKIGVNKWKNVIYREVIPIQKRVANSALTSERKSVDFEIRPINTKQPATLNVVSISAQDQSGLIYRVQVGALSKPPAPALFQEFTPVTSEVLSNGITRYLAGSFNNQVAVQTAHQQIKQLGYVDAFIVAYCDGQRISFAEARRMEALKLCIPKGNNNLAFQATGSQRADSSKGQSAAQANQISVSNQLSNYNQAPGAVAAQPIENEKGLFYTVQIGVFNRPVPDAQVKNLDSLYTLRVPNGQMRYTSGKYTSIAQAKPKRLKAQSVGIADAFITVYWNGQRISFEEAARIISEKGPAVFMTEIPIATKEATAFLSDVQLNEVPEKLDNTAEKQYYRLVSDATFTAPPFDLIQELGALGSFYYDDKSGKIVSVEKEIGDDAPVPKGFMRALLIESERNSAAIVLTVKGTEISGTFADWLLRANLPIQIRKQGKKTIYYLLVKDRQTVQTIIDYLNEHKIVEEYQIRMNELKL
jgi:hypothetical protein